MQSKGEGYRYLGIPEGLAEVLASTVSDLRISLSARQECAWAQLTDATLSRCVLHFACLYREHESEFPSPAVACSEVFHLFAEQLTSDTTADQWGVPVHMVPVVAGTVAVCGELVVERMGLDS